MKQVLDFKPLLGMSSQMSDEHQRNWTKDKWEKKVSAPEYNYDQTRAHLNFEVAHGGIIMPIDTSKNVPQKMKDRFAKLGIKDPNLKKGKRKYRTVATVIIGGSTKLINKLAFGNQKVDFNKGADNSKIKRHRDIEDWAKDMYAFASEQWGEDNIVGFYVHLDESWVHIHCSVMPITKDGKLNFNRWYTDDGKYDFRERMLFWHDRLAEYNQKWGLARGTSVKVTGAKHISTEEYRRNLAKKCAGLKRKLPDAKSPLRR